MVFDVMLLRIAPRGYGATAARLTPDQKVGNSNLSGLMTMFPMCLHPQSWNGKSLLHMSCFRQRAVGNYKFFTTGSMFVTPLPTRRVMSQRQRV